MTRCNSYCLSNYLKRSLVLLFLLFPLFSNAEVVPDIYSVRIPVMDESAAERTRGITAGLAQVLVKATGKPRAAKEPSVAELLNRAQRYVSEYRYIYPQQEGSVQNGVAPILHVKYLEAGLVTALRALQMPVWPADRPVLLLWVTELSDSGPRPLSPSEPAYRSLIAALARRGMPVTTPLMDLQDQMNLSDLSESSGAQANTRIFARASERYGVKHWLRVNYRLSSEGVSGAWALSGGAMSAGDSVSAASLTGFMVSSADRVVESFSEHFSYASRETSLLVSVLLENIVSYEDYQQALSSLQSLELVRDVQVSAMQGTELSLSLQLNGEGQRLFEVLDKDERFTYIAQVGEKADTARRYSWGGE